MVLWISWIFKVFFVLNSHPLHMSFTNVEYNESEQIWEGSVKLFKDDFADEMLRLYGEKLDLEGEKEDSVHAECFDLFISEYLEISINEDVIDQETWKYEGRRLNFEAIWLNYSFTYSEVPKIVKLRNTLMFSLFNDQKNLVIFNYKGKQKAFQFRQNKPEIEFKTD